MDPVQRQLSQPNGVVEVEPETPITLYGLVPLLIEIWKDTPDARSFVVVYTTPTGMRVRKLVGPELLRMDPR